MSIQVSFIIPHKGREEMLVETIASIANLDYDLEKIEVLVVSQNEKLDCLAQFDPNLLKAMFPEPGHTISALRNLGAQQAKGQYLAFLDADVALSANWLTEMIGLLEQKPSRKLVAAMQVDSASAPVLERIRTVLSNAELDTEVSFLPGRNLFLHRDTFDQVGGFPEHLITCEDYYFTDQVNQLGDLYYSSRAQYVHIGEDKALGPMFNKEVWRGQSNLQSIRGRNVPLREIPSFVVPPVMLLGVLVALVCLFTTNYFFAAMAFALFLLPVFVYSVRLYKLAKGKIPMLEIIKFYSVYFPARAKGTILGLVHSFGVKGI